MKIALATCDSLTHKTLLELVQVSELHVSKIIANFAHGYLSNRLIDIHFKDIGFFIKSEPFLISNWANYEQ